jgi:hypothetical protein
VADAIAVVGIDTTAYTDGERRIADSNNRIAQNAAATEDRINSARAVNESNLNGSLLRGERRVSSSAAFIAQQLTSIQTPAQGVALALEGAARIFQIGFAPTVAIAAAFAAFQEITEQIKATEKADSDLRLAFSKSHALIIGGGGLDTLKSQIDNLTGKLEAKIKDSSSFLRRSIDLSIEALISTAPGGAGVAGFGTRAGAAQSEILSAEDERRKLLEAIANTETKIVDIKETGLKGSSLQAELDKIDLDTRNKIAALILDPTATGTNFQEREAAIQRAGELDKSAAREKQLIIDTTNLSETKASQFRGTAEQTTLNTLKEQLSVAQAIFNVKSAPGGGTAEEQSAAFKNLSSAKSAIDQFTTETLFKNLQELEAAKAITEEMDLRAHGEERAAKSAETRERFERQIVADIHAGNFELAAQAGIQGRQVIAGALGGELTRTPQEINQQAITAALAANQTAIGEAAIRSARQDIEHGARLDESSPILQAIRDQDALIKAEREKPKDEKGTVESNVQAILDFLNKSIASA